MENKLLSIFCGILFGLGTLVIKLSFINSSLSLLFVGFAIGGFGFLLMQFALKNYFANIVTVVISGVSTVLSVFGGVVYLSEALTILKVFGIMIIMLGIVIVGVKS